MLVRSSLASLAMLALAWGCSEESTSGSGFHLPAGDVQEGRSAFQALGCVECHSVAGEADLPAPVASVTLELGGELHKVRTYGQLVTSIIDPSHSISNRAPKEVRETNVTTMKNFNDAMTVTQLIDLVSFLHSKYVQLEPAYNPVPF